MAGVGSYLPVAFLLLWLPKGYWNFTLSVTWFWQVVFFSVKATWLDLKYRIVLTLYLNAFEELGPFHVWKEFW